MIKKLLPATAIIPLDLHNKYSKLGLISIVENSSGFIHNEIIAKTVGAQL
jgi:hypothetical protein